ncbi:hypothetical protein JXB41_08940 [Candidatus Woesearchaeota archaeon]|nr:hypothetical protein [Candidatus Woesearchaeota archaeon]
MKLYINSLDIEENFLLFIVLEKEQLLIPEKPSTYGNSMIYTLLQYAKKNNSLKQKFKEPNVDFKKEFFLDILILTIIQLLSWRYFISWVPEYEIKKYGYKSTKFKQKVKKKEIKYKSLEPFLKKYYLYDYFKDTPMKKLVVPPDTELTLKKNKNERKIILSNEFMEINIILKFSSWTAGLRIPIEDLPFSDETEKKYETIGFYVNFEVTSNKLKSLFSNKSVDYFIWADDILNCLKADIGF